MNALKIGFGSVSRRSAQAMRSYFAIHRTILTTTNFCCRCRRSFGVSAKEELSFAWITPRRLMRQSVAKARVGGIIARLLSTPGIELAGARMYSPSSAFLQEYVHVLQESSREDGIVDNYEEAFMNFVKSQLSHDNCKQKNLDNHTLLLLFKGQKTVQTLTEVVGLNLPPPQEYGKTIRGTYGDYSQMSDGKILDFHPAVLTPPSSKSNRDLLSLFAKYAEKDGGILQPFNQSPNAQTGLIMIKPDNLERPSALPGHIIDLFGSTGLHLIAARFFSMTVAQAQEFYGFLEQVFAKKLVPTIKSTLQNHLQGAVPFPIEDTELSGMADALKLKWAKSEVQTIIHYMTGIDPKTINTEEERHKLGPAKCLALLYNGTDAIEKLREKLGSTDPRKAAAGTIRVDYGHDIMRNGAHASDSVASAHRECNIIGLTAAQPSLEKKIIEDWLKATS